MTSGRLFIGNIDYDGTEEELAAHFAQVGEVKSAEIVVNPHNNKPKGFAFVEMGDVEQAKRAVAELNDKPFLTRSLLVSGAKSDGAKKGRDQGGKTKRSRNEGKQSDKRDRQGKRNKKREHSDSKDPAVKPIEIEKVSGPGLRLENLNSEFSEEDLKDLFDGVGQVADHHIDKEFTLVQMANTEHAQKAVEVLHAKDFMGKRLKVVGAELESSDEAPTGAEAVQVPEESSEGTQDERDSQ